MAELVAIARREKTRAPMEELEAAEVTAEAGVARDFRGKPGKRQVTVLSEEAWRAACAEVGADLSWTLRRANLLVRGLELAQTTGRRLAIGDVILEITCETDPCHVMDAQHEGLRKALEPAWRGGVSCRVVTGGRVHVGDPARFADAG